MKFYLATIIIVYFGKVAGADESFQISHTLHTISEAAGRRDDSDQMYGIVRHFLISANPGAILSVGTCSGGRWNLKNKDMNISLGSESIVQKSQRLISISFRAGLSTFQSTHESGQ